MTPRSLPRADASDVRARTALTLALDVVLSVSELAPAFAREAGARWLDPVRHVAPVAWKLQGSLRRPELTHRHPAERVRNARRAGRNPQTIRSRPQALAPVRTHGGRISCETILAAG